MSDPPGVRSSTTPTSSLYYSPPGRSTDMSSPNHHNGHTAPLWNGTSPTTIERIPTITQLPRNDNNSTLKDDDDDDDATYSNTNPNLTPTPPLSPPPTKTTTATPTTVQKKESDLENQENEYGSTGNSSNNILGSPIAQSHSHNSSNSHTHILTSPSTSTTMRLPNSSTGSNGGPQPISPSSISTMSLQNSKSGMILTNTATPTTPYQQHVPSGSPLMNNNSMNHISSPTTTASPRMQLPLPPPVTTTTPMSDTFYNSIRSSVNTSTGSTKATKPLTGITATTSTTTTSTTTPQQKAQKFSSLKKRKQQHGGGIGHGSNALLNRLFCNNNSSYIISSNNSLIEEEDLKSNKNNVEQPQNSTDGTSTTGNKIRETITNNVDVTACVKIGTHMLEQASESLTLHDEDKVRADIQSTIQDTLDIVCTPNTSTTTTSPPTYSSTTKVSAFLHATKHSPQRNNSQHKNSHSMSNVQIQNMIATSDDQPSDESIEIIDSDGNIEPSVSQSKQLNQIETKHPDSICITSSQSSDDGSIHKTPIRRNKTNNGTNPKPMKTPGGLVIPSPFTHNSSSKGLFPSTFGNPILPLTSYLTKSASTAAATSAATVTTSTRKISSSSSRKESKLQHGQGHPVPIVYIPDMTTTSSSTSTTMATSTASTIASINDPSSPPSSSFAVTYRHPDRIETQRRHSPILVRITSSMEDLETVPEVTTSKEFDDATTTTAGDTTESHCHNHNNGVNDKKSNINNDIEDEAITEHAIIDETEFLPNRSSTDVITPKGHELPQRQLSKSPIPNEEHLSSHHRMMNNNLTSNNNNNNMDDLRIQQYERKLSEQKDQIALSNRVAKMRLEEIERLESIMDTLKDRPSNTDEIQRLKDRLQQQQQEKKKEIERVRSELQLQLEQQNQDWMQKQNKYQSMEEELMQVKQRLVEAETSVRPMITLVSSNEVNEEVERLKAALVDANMALKQKEDDVKKVMQHEVVALKQQLSLCREELANAMASSSEAMNPSVELQISTETERLQLQVDLAHAKEELSKVKNQLIRKEKELVNTKKNLSTVETTPTRYTNPRTTPVRSGSKVRSRTSLSNNDSTSKSSIMKQREDLQEMNEREKETLRNQISLLTAQAAEMSQEHDRALMELRRANEIEIARIKTEMESRLEHHKIMERELKESLSTASSNEREELLEQIEILQAEKKLDQLSGLRDVQKREELLQRITTLEQNDKALSESHERAVEQLRIQSAAEIQKLRVELQSQEELRLEREKEIEMALAESYSFEKNTLAHKIENLEGLLESERSGAVLLRIKISNFEKDMDGLKQQHRQALEAHKASTADEIQRLQMELKNRLALEEAMQITTNERDTFEEELKMLRLKYDHDTRKLSEKMEELKKMHNHEKTVMTNEMLGKITKLENELNESRRDIDQASNQKCEVFKAKHEEQLDHLMKAHAEEIGTLRLEMHSIEEKYKVLVTESNVQFESFQKDAEIRIEELKETIRTNEERYTVDLKLAEQRTNTEDQKLLEHYEELKKLQTQHESQMKAAEARHNKHFEDLLAQLDLVEAEQLQTTAAKDKALSEKDAIVDALGSQLAEAQRKISEAQSTRASDMTALEESRKSYQALEKVTQTLRNEIRDLKEMQKKFMKEAELKKEKACEEAREEMIEKAEVQFQQANEHYVKLRKQYDESQERAKKFEAELKLLRKKVEKLTKEKESTEIDLKAELAQLNATNAKIEADSAQKAKEYRREMERLLQTAKIFEAKAEEATATSRSIQTTLATVVAEKQKLQQEYEEMKSVSEELMAIVEGGERHEC